jgi:hypothetical protein
MPTTHLRLSRELVNDLNDTIIQMEIQFLKEVARDLGLPIQEVLKRCMGMGAMQAMLIGDDETEPCPWWSRSADGLWQPCRRLRLTPTTPCSVHASTKPSSHCCLGSDDRLTTVQEAIPLLWEGTVYWSTPEATFREDGVCVPLTFKRIQHQGAYMWVKSTG